MYILVRYFEGFGEEENVAVSHDKAKLEALIKEKQEQAKLREKLHEEYMVECKLLQVSIPDVKPPKTIKELGKEAHEIAVTEYRKQCVDRIKRIDIEAIGVILKRNNLPADFLDNTDKPSFGVSYDIDEIEEI
jgi:hypothetical protein